MPNWKKVIVSGSNISQLNNDGVYLRNTGDGILSSSAQIATQISGAFNAASASFDARISSIQGASGIYASTGSNSFKGIQTFSGSLLPETTEAFGLGSADYIWAELYVDGQSIYMRDTATNTFVTMSANAGVLTFNNAGLNVPLGITSSKIILSSVVNAGVDTDKFLVLDSAGNVDFRTGAEVLSDIGGQTVSPGTVSSSAQIQAYNIFLEKLGDNVISSSAQIATQISGAFTATSGGFSTRITTLENAVNNTTFSASIQERVTYNEIDIAALQVTSSQAVHSIQEGSQPFSISFDRYDGTNQGSALLTNTKAVVYNFTSSANTRLASLEAATSSYALKTAITGAFTAPSASISTRLTALEGAGGTTFSASVSTRLTSVEGYTLDNVTDNGSTTTNAITIGGLTVNGNAVITGKITAQEFNTEYVSSSIIFTSGSTKFGDTSDDIHSFTGSVKLNTQTAATTDTDKFLVFDTGGQIKYRTGTQVLSDINPGGLISSSAQLTTEFDTRYLNTTGDGVISSSAQLTTEFDTRYLNTTGDGVISSSAQVTISSTTGYTTFSSSIASDIAGLQGAGFIDGNGGNEFFARFTDSNTITGSNHLQRDIYGNIAINSRTGNWNLAGFSPVAPLTLRRGTDDGAVTHNLAYLQAPNNRASSLQFANGSHSTFIGQETDGDFFIGFGNQEDRTFVFQNNGAGGVPTLTLGTLTISGSGTLKNIGPAQFSGSVSITTANQVAATVDTDKFLVIDGQQLKYRTGAQVLSDIGGIAVGTIKNYVNVNNVVDFKAITDGYAPVTGITDIQTSPNSPFAHWIAPSDGYLERVVLMVGETNTTTDDFAITVYKNGSQLGSTVNVTQGAVRTVTEFSFGGTYSYQKRDRIVFGVSKATNTSDLYTFNAYFYTNQ